MGPLVGSLEQSAVRESQRVREPTSEVLGPVRTLLAQDGTVHSCRSLWSLGNRKLGLCLGAPVSPPASVSGQTVGPAACHYSSQLSGDGVNHTRAFIPVLPAAREDSRSATKIGSAPHHKPAASIAQGQFTDRQRCEGSSRGLRMCKVRVTWGSSQTECQS